MRKRIVRDTISAMSMINIEIKKNSNENNMGIVRRFTRRVQESGILNRVRSIRYNNRKPGSLAQKNMALKKINRRIEIERLKKLGKMT